MIHILKWRIFYELYTEMQLYLKRNKRLSIRKGHCYILVIFLIAFLIAYDIASILFKPKNLKEIIPSFIKIYNMLLF